MKGLKMWFLIGFVVAVLFVFVCVKSKHYKELPDYDKLPSNLLIVVFALLCVPAWPMFILGGFFFFLIVLLKEKDENQ